MAKYAVAMVADAALIPAASYLAHRLASLNTRDDTEILIFSDSVDGLRAIAATGVKAGLRYVDFSGRFPRFNERISGAAYFRFFLPDVLAETVERVLYLDVDIAVENGSVFRLFDLDMDGHTIAAVRDLVATLHPSEEVRREVMRSGDGRYFNSGVVLIDCAPYVAQGASRTLLEVAARERTHDQAALNTVFARRWLELSPAMNMLTAIWNSFVRRAFPPAVVHFAGTAKPWQADFVEDHSVRADMVSYFRNSPWQDFVRSPDFAAAWRALQQGSGPVATAARTKTVLQRPTDVPALAALLPSLRFADVEQGITPYNKDAIPAG
jgi:lipopolysaccharide biosynthesis glycosyltransferase